MALITEWDRYEEFENIKEWLDELDIPSEILKKGEQIEQTCLLVSLPTAAEDWEKEFKEDMHMATGYLLQLDDSPKQQTKYLMLYAPIQVELRGISEDNIYGLINEANRTSRVGTYFYDETPKDGRRLIQLKWMIGGYVGEMLDEGVICEAIYELGYAYDKMKEKILKLKNELKIAQG